MSVQERTNMSTNILSAATSTAAQAALASAQSVEKTASQTLKEQKKVETKTTKHVNSVFTQAQKLVKTAVDTAKNVNTTVTSQLKTEQENINKVVSDLETAKSQLDEEKAQLDQKIARKEQMLKEHPELENAKPKFNDKGEIEAEGVDSAILNEYQALCNDITSSQANITAKGTLITGLIASITSAAASMQQISSAGAAKLTGNANSTNTQLNAKKQEIGADIQGQIQSKVLNDAAANASASASIEASTAAASTDDSSLQAQLNAVAGKLNTLNGELTGLSSLNDLNSNTNYPQVQTQIGANAETIISSAGEQAKNIAEMYKDYIEQTVNTALKNAGKEGLSSDVGETSVNLTAAQGGKNDSINGAFQGGLNSISSMFTGEGKINTAQMVGAGVNIVSGILNMIPGCQGIASVVSTVGSNLVTIFS